VFQVIITAALPDRRSPTKFINVATLVLATACERATAEWLCDNAEESSDYLRMVFTLQGLFPGCQIATGVRPVVTDIMPQR
jgi:hypothetical protein